MIRSMTGFGRAQDILDGMSISVELKSVNHRYFEFSARTPRTFGFLDEKLKHFFQQYISRGKTECYVSIETLDMQDCTVDINHTLASGYMKAFQELSDRYGLENDMTVASFARYNDIFSIRKEDADEERVWNAVKTVAEQALRSFLAMREAEGEKLKADVLSRCDLILEHVAFMHEDSARRRPCGRTAAADRSGDLCR